IANQGTSIDGGGHPSPRSLTYLPSIQINPFFKPNFPIAPGFRSNADSTRVISKSIFVTNFPNNTTAKDLWNLYQGYGTYVFIPNRLSKAGKRFTFVRFIRVDNLDRLVGMTSIIINGSPTLEFQLHRGLKQGDPLAPYLFILVMESLHLSITRATNVGLFKGVMVRGNMSLVKSWDEIIGKLNSRLSKWKCSTLSIGGRFTLLKSVLGSSPIYTMSLYKVPKSVLNEMESIRRKFFYGSHGAVNKITWVKWSKVLAAKNTMGSVFPVISL
nr:RNA-directed DNA polymerase, eukaryota, reverse transcriptase zinc-binding domain protein [Tanacetum cinerariifolium]